MFVLTILKNDVCNQVKNDHGGESKLLSGFNNDESRPIESKTE